MWNKIKEWFGQSEEQPEQTVTTTDIPASSDLGQEDFLQYALDVRTTNARMIQSITPEFLRSHTMADSLSYITTRLAFDMERSAYGEVIDGCKIVVHCGDDSLEITFL